MRKPTRQNRHPFAYSSTRIDALFRRLACRRVGTHSLRLLRSIEASHYRRLRPSRRSSVLLGRDDSIEQTWEGHGCFYSEVHARLKVAPEDRRSNAFRRLTARFAANCSRRRHSPSSNAAGGLQSGSRRRCRFVKCH